MAITRGQRSSQAALSSQSRPVGVMISRRLFGRRRRRRPGLKQKKAAKEEKKILYMFMKCSQRGPVTQALYAVDLSSSSSYGTCQLEEVKNDPLLENSPSIYPVVEFYFGDYPVDMSCVVLGSKLYFFGGHTKPKPDSDYSWRVFSRKVYYIDTAEHPLLGKSEETLDAKSLVVKDDIPDMLSTKPHCYGFAACDKLYVIGDDIGYSEKPGHRHKVFEVYDPAHPDQGWIPLPRPPPDIHAIVVEGSVVIGKKVVFLTGEGILSFHLHNLVWTYINTGPLVLCPDACGQAAVVLRDKTAYSYWDADGGVVSIGPVGDVDKDLDDKDRGRSASGEFSNHLKVLRPKGTTPTSGIHHLGKDVFCYVMVGLPPNPGFLEDPWGNLDGDTFVCSIIVFEFPTNSLPPPAADGGVKRLQRPFPTPTTVLHTKRFSCRITRPMQDLRYGYMSCSFLAPPPASRQKRVHL